MERVSDLPVTVVAGGLSGMAVDFIFYPLDTLKTLQQAKTGTAKTAVTPSLRLFYRGLFSAMAGSFPGAATFWTAYEGSKALGERYFGDSLGSGLHMGAAAVADVAVVSVRTPFEVVKQQMQVGLHSSTSNAVRRIIQSEGLLGLYSGWGSTVIREVPFDAIQFGCYEWFKKKWGEYVQRPLHLGDNAVLGTISGVIAAALTTPLDVAKTRLMTQYGTKESERYHGVIRTLIRIVKEEGYRALFAGMGPRVAWIGLGGAIFIGTFEELRRQFRSVVSVSPEDDEQNDVH